MDGLVRRRGAALQRLLRIDGEPVLVGIVQPARDRVLLAARAATSEAARAGIERMRFATGVDDDLRPFHDRFRDDPVIGRSVRTDRTLRVRRHPDPWQTLLGAITEQLIATARPRRSSPVRRRPGSSRSTSRPSGRSRCGAAPRRSRAGGSTCTMTTSGACWRSARSARGPPRWSACTARAGWTWSQPGTSAS